jgi:tRNA (guanine37-N1)-methyltransferase
MTFHIISIFPESFESYFSASIIKRAQDKKLVKIKFYNLRNFTKDKHKTVDDKPYGGGPGMVVRIEPIIRTIVSILNKLKIKNFPPKANQPRAEKLKIILLSPSGKQFNQKMARDYAKKYQDIILICGHYEGIDARLKPVLRVTGYALQEISIGSYILSGGEAGAMVIVDAVSRHIPGVLGKFESLEEKKGSYPVYTRPEIFEFKSKKYRVPKVLLSGDHRKISEWRSKHGKIVS